MLVHTHIHTNKTGPSELNISLRTLQTRLMDRDRMLCVDGGICRLVSFHEDALVDALLGAGFKGDSSGPRTTRVRGRLRGLGRVLGTGDEGTPEALEGRCANDEASAGALNHAATGAG